MYNSDKMLMLPGQAPMYANAMLADGGYFNDISDIIGMSSLLNKILTLSM